MPRRAAPVHPDIEPSCRLGAGLGLGPVSTGWLADVGIVDASQLRAVGAVDAWERVRASGAPASLNLLYALEAAVRGVDWRTLPDEVKTRLRRDAGRR